MRVINAALIGFGLAGSVFHAPIINSTEGINLTLISKKSAAPLGDGMNCSARTPVRDIEH